MAKAKKKASKGRSRKAGATTAENCRIVTVCGKRRKICWARKRVSSGKMRTVIVSNTAASGGGGKKSGMASYTVGGRMHVGRGVGGVRVSRAQALRRDGTLRKGCRFVKGGGAICKR